MTYPSFFLFGCVFAVSKKAARLITGVLYLEQLKSYLDIIQFPRVRSTPWSTHTRSMWVGEFSILFGSDNP
jgi:hypothetical protein